VTGSAGGGPNVSVVIPTRSRPGPLRECLDALARACGGVSHEIIVVDDGTPSRLVAGVEEAVTAAGARLLRQARCGAAAARNLGAAEARGRVLVFLDDDCQPQPGWLGALVAASAEGDNLLVGGPTVNGAPRNLFAEATQLLVAYLSHGRSGAEDEVEFLPSCNLALDRDAFARVGGFDSSFAAAGGEDRELCARCLREGLELRFVPEAAVRHFHHLRLLTYLRQHFRYGRGAVLFRRRCAEAGGSARLAAPRWYLGLLAFPFRRSGTARAVPLTALLALAQLVTAVGVGVEKLYRRTPSNRNTVTRPEASGKRSMRSSEKKRP